MLRINAETSLVQTLLNCKILLCKQENKESGSDRAMQYYSNQSEAGGVFQSIVSVIDFAFVYWF